MIVYRDCNQGVMNNSANLSLKCATTGSLINTLTIPLPPPIDITPSCGGSCSRCQDSNCSYPYGIEEYTFTKLLVFDKSLSCCNIIISFSDCCRSKAFTNIQAGSPFYLEAKMNRCLSPCDNSPSSNNPPIAIMCKGTSIVTCGMTDIDIGDFGGMLDSLVYEWTPPLVASNTAVSFNSPFTYQKPLYFKGYPNDTLAFPSGFHLSNCGGMNFHTDSLGFSLFAFKVKEYRNGKLIGEITREITIIVIECPKNNAPVLSGPFYKEVGEGQTVNFSIATNDYDTKDSLRISWNNS